MKYSGAKSRVGESGWECECGSDHQMGVHFLPSTHSSWHVLGIDKCSRWQDSCDGWTDKPGFSHMCLVSLGLESAHSWIAHQCGVCCGVGVCVLTLPLEKKHEEWAKQASNSMSYNMTDNLGLHCTDIFLWFGIFSFDYCFFAKLSFTTCQLFLSIFFIEWGSTLLTWQFCNLSVIM